jgi:hypothetical protein
MSIIPFFAKWFFVGFYQMIHGNGGFFLISKIEGKERVNWPKGKDEEKMGQI